MTPVLLDAGVLIDLIRDCPRAREWLQRFPKSACKLSCITTFEVWSGARFAREPAQEEATIRHLIRMFGEEAFDGPAAEAAARVRQELESAGAAIGPFDALLAGHALARNWAVATANAREFRRIKGLQVHEWTRPTRRRR